MAVYDRDTPDTYFPTTYMPEDSSLIAARQAAENAYYTQKVGTTGKTQAQLDAAVSAAEVAKSTNQYIDPKTGYVVPDKPEPVVNLRDKSTIPEAPDGYVYKWIGSTGSGSWTLYKKTPPASTSYISGSGGNGGFVPAPAGTDPALLALIASLQKQIVDLTNSNAAAATVAKAEALKKAESERQSIIATLTDRFSKYGLTSLVNKVRELAIDGATEATITLALQETPEYQQRFRANAERLKKGLTVLNPAEYLNLEDGYRQVLRAYGLKQFDTDEYVQQFIANDVSAAEMSNRVVTAVQRVQNADPAVQKQLRDYYGIGATDLVAYVLDPQQQFQKIERQVAASEIGVAAARQGLQAGVGVAEQLAAQGVTQAEAQRGYATIADILPTAEKLSSIYGNTMETYGQSEGEQEVFNQLASAQRKREKLTAREVAAFSGGAGTNKTSLTTSSVGQF